jgi:ATP-dependent RNA helicase DDX49/DBP8
VYKCLEVLPSPESRQTLLFTATVTEEVRALKEKPRPPGRPPLKVVEIATENVATPATLKQTFVLVPERQRESYLHTLLTTPLNSTRSAIIFCNSKAIATYLEYVLRILEHRVTSLHSGLSQRDRINNLARFRAKVASILIATDVAARGLDIPTVDLVVNYNVPRNPDDYIHRVGRTARAGRQGLSVTLVDPQDVSLVLAIEERVNEKMAAYEEQDVNIKKRVENVSNLKLVGDAKSEAVVRLEEGRDVKGKRRAQKLKKRR